MLLLKSVIKINDVVLDISLSGVKTRAAKGSKKSLEVPTTNAPNTDEGRLMPRQTGRGRGRGGLGSRSGRGGIGSVRVAAPSAPAPSTDPSPGVLEAPKVGASQDDFRAMLNKPPQ